MNMELEQLFFTMGISSILMLFVFFFLLNADVEKQKKRIDPIELSLRDTNEKVHSLFAFTTQSVDDATDSDDRFKNDVYQNFKFLNKKIDKLISSKEFLIKNKK